jgi:hypothetical protein
MEFSELTEELRIREQVTYSRKSQIFLLVEIEHISKEKSFTDNNIFNRKKSWLFSKKETIKNSKTVIILREK